MPSNVARPALPILVLAASLAFAPGAGADSPPTAQAPAAPAADGAPRLGLDVVPVAQSLRLHVDPREDAYAGSAAIALEVRREVQSFWLHAAGIEVDRVRIERGDSVLEPRHRVEGDRLLLELAEPLERGDVTLLIAFHRPFGTRAVGLYVTKEAGESYAFTDFEPANARQAFPCFDEPSFKIPFEITVEVPEAHIAVSNTPVEAESVIEGRRLVRFRRTKPLPTYLLALATGPLETVPITGLSVPGRVVVPRGRTGLTALAVEMTPLILAAHERWFGTPYPFEKLDLLAVPDFWHGAMENPGAITFAEEVLLQDAKRAGVSGRRRIARVISHELAHMWFGDLVTMRWWDDLWLNEAFAEYAGDRVTVELWPEVGLEENTLIDRNSTMNGDARASSEAIRRPVPDPKAVLSGVLTQYRKGKTVIRMFEAWMGPEVFQQGVRAYLREHAWGNAVAADLWSALGKASGRDVAAAMGSFIEQPGVPLLDFEVSDRGRVRITVSRFAAVGTTLPPLRWQVPLRMRWADARGSHETALLVDRAEQTVELEPEGKLLWLHPDAAARGYFRYALPPERLAALAASARTSHTAGHPAGSAGAGGLTREERIGFVGNLGALLVAGRIGGADLLRMVRHFAADDEPAVVAAALAAIDAVQVAFAPAADEEAFAAYLRETLRPALRTVGLDPAEGEDEAKTLLRPTLILTLARDAHDPEVLRLAAAKADAYLADRTALPPGTVGAWLRSAAFSGDAARFDAFRKAFEAAEVPMEREALLGALGAFRAPELQDRALAYALATDGPVRAKEMFGLAFPLLETPAGRDKLWAWLKASFPAIAKRLPAENIAGLPRFATGCESARIEDARRFFAEPPQRVEGTERSLARVADSIADCVRLREREGAAVSAWLRAGAPEDGAPASGAGGGKRPLAAH